VSTTLLPLIGVLALATLHVLAANLHRNAQVPPTWLTAASGMSVAYVFLHLLPELGQEQAEWLHALPDRPLPWLESQVYIATFLGVILALGLDRAVQVEKRRFRLRIGAFAIYNVLLGCFALRVKELTALALAVIAFGAHLLLHDRALYLEFGQRFERWGRWILAASLLVGWCLGWVWPPPVILTAGVLGLVAGGIITNVIKEELPRRDEEGFSPWLAGALSYSGLLLALEYTAHS
jgi:hypothetical protein